MALRYSHSRLSTFENCPRQYRYRYIDKLPRLGPGVEAHVGISVHQALERLYNAIKEGREAPGRQQVLDFYRQSWEETDPETLRIVRRGFDLDDYFELGRHCVQSYYDLNAPFTQTETIAVEKKVEIQLDRAGRYQLIGYMDRLARAADGTYEIHDYKTSSSLPWKDDLKNDRQLALYEMGIRRELGADESIQVRHIWHYLTFEEVFTRELTRERLRSFARSTMKAIDTVEAASTYPARTSALCHWCDFNQQCEEGGTYVETRPAPGLPAA